MPAIDNWFEEQFGKRCDYEKIYGLLGEEEGNYLKEYMNKLSSWISMTFGSKETKNSLEAYQNCEKKYIACVVETNTAFFRSIFEIKHSDKVYKAESIWHTVFYEKK
ncbi:MAG TPA: hypothetical protein VJB11_03630 [archaeon]|nr:hypothetical protein [archaeon]